MRPERPTSFVNVAAFSLVTLATSTSTAQAPAPDSTPPVVSAAWFNRLADQTVTGLKTTMAIVHQADIDSKSRRSHRFRGVALHTPSLDRASATSAIELASAAVRTSIDGVEAGAAIAPAALFGVGDSPHQPTLIVAALADDRTRYAFGYNFQTPWEPQTPADLDLPACRLTPKQEKKLRETMEHLRFAYEDVCEGVREAVLHRAVRARRESDPSDLEQLAEKEARYACMGEGIDPESPLTLERAVIYLHVFFENEEKRTRTDSDKGLGEWLTFHRAFAPHEAHLRALSEFKEPPVDCYRADDIRAAYAQASWASVSYRFGASFTIDTFANVFGFNPKPSDELTKGQPARVEGRIEGARVTGSFEIHLGAGIGRSRDALADPFALYVAPTLSVAVVVASLSGDPLYRDGKLDAVDGKPPPRLVVGLDGELQYAFDPPESQVTHFSAVKITPFADFLFTDSLGFRLGVPLRGKVVTRAADASQLPPVVERRDLQWSIPIFLTTVLKM